MKLDRKKSSVHRTIVFGMFCLTLLIVDLTISFGRQPASEPADQKVFKFQFGTATSAKRAGFTKVTSKDVFTPENDTWGVPVNLCPIW